MWISKRRFRELEKRIADLEEKTKSRSTDEVIADGVAKAVIDKINRITKSSGKSPLVI